MKRSLEVLVSPHWLWRQPKATSTNSFGPVNLTLGSTAFGQAQGRTGLSMLLFQIILYNIEEKSWFYSCSCNTYVSVVSELYVLHSCIIISPVRFVVSGLKFNWEYFRVFITTIKKKSLLKKREMHLHKCNQTSGLSCILSDNKRVKFIHPLQLIETGLILILT